MIMLLDTDVLIDVALDRDPYAAPAAGLLDHLQTRPGWAYVAWHSLSNFYYLVSSAAGKDEAKHFVEDLCSFVEVATTTTDSLRAALSLPMADFEDAMQAAAALACNAEVIVTRNLRHYARSPVPAKKPRTVLGMLTRT